VRIKLPEIVLSGALIAASILNLNSDEAFFKGLPVYDWVGYVVLAGGAAIPILAWFLRSPARNKKTDE
jgi:hypothetical protein